LDGYAGGDAIHGSLTKAVTDSGVAEAIQSRRSIRRFKSDPIDVVQIEDAIRVALWAPSPHNAQPWRFVWLSPDTKEKVARVMAAELVSELEASGAEPAAAQALAARSIDRIDGAPSALVCCTVDDGLALSGDPAADSLERLMAVQSVGAVFQSLALALAEKQIGSCWMAAPMYCPEVIRSALDLPATMYPQALILIGYPAADGRIRPRRSFDEVFIKR
jgi:F420 biosynthesis protein FbiB-like protein